MRLLVSVRNASEAGSALAGGADIIDAKEPLNGPLGAVSSDVLHRIASTVGNAAPVSAALGEISEDDVLDRAVAARQAGVTFVKAWTVRMSRPVPASVSGSRARKRPRALRASGTQAMLVTSPVPMSSSNASRTISFMTARLYNLTQPSYAIFASCAS